MATDPREPRWKTLLRKIAEERTSPHEVGFAVCLGVTVGTTPFWGGHTLICIGLASVLRLNRAIAVLASNYSIPPLFPFVAFASMQIGRFLTTGETVPITFEAFAKLDAMEFMWDWAIGAPVLGLLIGVPTGALAAAVVARTRRRAAAEGG